MLDHTMLRFTITDTRLYPTLPSPCYALPYRDHILLNKT